MNETKPLLSLFQYRHLKRKAISSLAPIAQSNYVDGPSINSEVAVAATNTLIMA